MRPVIGIVPLVDHQRDSLWMLPDYMEGVAQAGGLPIMLPLTDDEAQLGQLLGMCSGILFTGGQDVDPAVYNAEKLEICGELCPRRDRMELPLLRAALEADKPVLGICRGLQFINAALGGTLYQDLSRQHPSNVCHRMQPPYHLPAHTVCLEADSPLQALLGAETIAVNSCHHQGIANLACSLRPMATAEDGLIEAIYHPGKRFVWAVQWHPEFSHKTDENSRKIFKAFIEKCR